MIESFFSPSSVAVIGASRDPHKLGHGVVRNLLKYNFKGEIYPVHHTASEILGLRCYSSVAELPDEVDLAVIVVPARSVPDVVEQCGQVSIKQVIIVSGGFGETGEEGGRLEEKVMEIAGRYGIRMIGPNCIGTIDTHTPVNTTFVVGMPEQGEIGFISQSGAMVAAVIDWALGAGVGFSRLVSLGNQIDVTETEMVELIGGDRETKVVTAYIEGISDGRAFMETASAITKEKPFVVIKAGQSSKGAEAVSSHTGALSGSKEAYSAAFRKCGIQEARSTEEMFDFARALAWQPLPKGRRIAVLTNAGGPAILAVDAMEKAGLELADLSENTRSFLKARLPKAASINNPVDVLAGSGPATYTLALEALLSDDQVDAVLVIQAPQDWFLPESLAEVVGETAGLHKKPVIASIMGKASVDEALTILHKRRVPNVSFPERSAAVFLAMAERREWLEMQQARAEELQKAEKMTKVDGFRQDGVKGSAAAIMGALEVDEAAAEKSVKNKDWIGLAESWGIPVARQKLAETQKEAVDAADELGWPVALKLFSRKQTHKTDVGGVRLDLADEGELENAWEEIHQAAEKHGVDLEGMTVQKMIPEGEEVIIGVRRDPQFGSVVVFGSGGTEVELYRDARTAIAPLCRMEAEQLIDETIAGRKLQGWRGKAPSDREAVVEMLMRMGRLAEAHPEIVDLEINPLIVMEEGKGAVAVDLRGSVADREISVID